MTECLFCKIAEGIIPATIVDSDRDLLVFRDINPQAPVHILIIPRKHIGSVAEMEDQNAELVAKMICKARDLARIEMIEESGYRLVLNNGIGAGQSVFHIHLHLLGGRKFIWPPG